MNQEPSTSLDRRDEAELLRPIYPMVLGWQGGVADPPWQQQDTAPHRDSKADFRRCHRCGRYGRMVADEIFEFWVCANTQACDDRADRATRG